MVVLKVPYRNALDKQQLMIEAAVNKRGRKAMRDYEELEFMWSSDKAVYSDWIHEAWMMYQYALVLRELHHRN
jgi:hypothetical protein